MKRIKVDVTHSLKCNLWELNPQLFGQKARSVAWWWVNLNIVSIHGKCISTLVKMHLLGRTRGEMVAPEIVSIPSKCVSTYVGAHLLSGGGEILPASQLRPRQVSGFSPTRKSVYLVRFVTCPVGNRHLLAVKWSFFMPRRRRRRNILHEDAQTRKFGLKSELPAA